jgi:CheY-like chemotaxis protein
MGLPSLQKTGRPGIWEPSVSLNTSFNILVAEDNPDDVFFLEQAVKKASLTDRVIAVPDGVEAAAYLQGEGVYADRSLYPYPDFLLLDLNMPRMNGFELLEQIRQDPAFSHASRLVVHVLSASSREADVQRAYDLRANSYVIKPGRLDELVAFATALHDWHRFTALPEQRQKEAGVTHVS